jgi:L-lactate dehydrogenase complex protein LldF
MIEPFEQRYRRALNDPVLRENLTRFQHTWRQKRDIATASDEFDANRRRLVEIKDVVIADLPRYADQFLAAAGRSGATTFVAKTGTEAIEYVARLAAEHSTDTVVKSKSMVTEEIGLNHGLEALGLRVIETDLGEWIVQLAGERPSHITGPALHKNRRQIAELLSRATGKEVSREDIAEQVAVARETLRPEFFAGQIGITGANALVADSGTIVIATNEGNAELVTSLPPIHVAIVGIEKLVPTLEDAMLQLQLLARSATGQASTAYVSFITGPAEPGHELHVILLDNGRTQMQAEPEYASALRCIRCGACSSVCPSYGVVGGHVFGYIYSGAIGLVNTPFHHGIEHDVGPQSLCVSCNACQEVCPVDIPLPRQILQTRAAVAEHDGAPKATRAALELWSRPAAFRLAARLGAVAQLPIKRGAFLDPPLSRTQTEWRKPPALAPRPFRDRSIPDGAVFHNRLLGQTLQGCTVAYFVQCLTDWIYPEIGFAIVEVLTRLGATVTFPRAQHCCGLPALDAGFIEPAKRMAQHTISTLEATRADYVLTGGTSCAIAMIHDYPHLFQDDPAWRSRAEQVAGRVIDFTTFMHRVAHLPSGSLSGGPGEPATYHYFCQSYNVLGFRHEPLHLIQDVCGVRLIPLADANVCCGFGGSVSVNRPEMCRHILARKLESVEATGASHLITDNPGCILHLRGGIAARAGSVKVMHTAEVVAAAMRSVQQDHTTGR